MQYRPIRFPTGEVRATTAALANVSKEKLICLVNRHIRGNWGDTCMADQKANEQAIRDGDRILSWYQISGKIRILIITGGRPFSHYDHAGRRILIKEKEK